MAAAPRLVAQLAIVRHYLLSWFTIDISSIAVCAFDIIPLLPSGGGDATRSLRVMRVMRVLRLIKLIRLLRASRLFRRWETKLAINYSRLHLVRSIFNVCYVSHFFACVRPPTPSMLPRVARGGHPPPPASLLPDCAQIVHVTLSTHMRMLLTPAPPAACQSHAPHAAC